MKMTAQHTREAARALVGKKYSEVAEMYGVTVHGLRNALKRHGLFTARQRGAYKIQLSREDLELAIDMYTTNQKLKDIEAALNVGDEVIKRELKEVGLYKTKTITPRVTNRDAHQLVLQAIEFNNKFLSMRFGA